MERATFLTGEFRHALDDRGRVAVPVRFRPRLAEGATLARWLDGCLAIFPGPEWDDLATKIREMAPQAVPLVQQFGAVQSVRHEGKQGQMDLYRVTFENQATEWLIGLSAEDKIAGLLFRPAE